MHELLKEAQTNHANPLQARGDKGSEHRIINRCIVMQRSAQCKGCIGGRLPHNARIELFWK